MKKLSFLYLFISFISFSQNKPINTLSLEESLGYVKKHHPVLKQAKLITNTNEAKLMKARGAFDPKIAIDYDKKEFKDTDYYKKLTSTFKIPTWYGIELKASYENNSGQFLNPQSKTPKNGLYNVGVAIPLARNLFINKRMATLKQAKLYTKQGKLEQQLLINAILFNAIDAYLNWTLYYQQHIIYKDYYTNAQVRLKNVITSFKAGDKAAVDTLEASINLKSRKLDLEKANIKYIKSKLEFSNYLWIDTNIPMELKDEMIPDITTFSKMDVLLKSTANAIVQNNLNDHPKVKLLELKRRNLEINKQLKVNNLLPKIDFQYNLLSSKVDNLDAFNVSNYKNSLQVSVPLFLRKSRGELKLAKLKLQDLNFEISSTKIRLQNKINVTRQQIVSYEKQKNIFEDLVNGYKKIVKSEERKFSLGESSLFLINYREVKLIESNLKEVKNNYEYAKTKSALIQLLGQLNTL
ncbi:TolC family protein [Tenacibaculum retecalamus]|uniref:TolC family protein n=1 Tax=Tenacibaculum retecalamus TaxID=3018315 RepID=UPI0023D95E17|nr:TolC family protein [Tenacibaculum retecalamus]WBX72096.1 TolC family protein [Tenacibaculum retecalamus]